MKQRHRPWTEIVKVMTIVTALVVPGITATAQKLSIQKTTIDVGKTGFEVPVTATFELRNKGSKALIISDLKTDCGCTTADATQRTVEPGEQFTVTMTYNARMLGHFTKQVALYSNATQKPVYLKMRGVVLESVEDYSNRYPYDMKGLLTSADNIEFDDVNKGEHPEKEILLYNNTEEVMTPNMLHLPPYLTALATPETLEPSRSGKITLMLNSDLVNSYGLTQASIYMAHRLGDKISKDTEIPVSVVLLPDKTQFEGQDHLPAPTLLLSSDSVTLDSHHKKETITISNNGRSPLVISSLQMFTGGMKVKLDKREIQPGETAKLTIIVNRNQIMQSRTKPRVLLITNDPKRSKVVININIE